MGLMWPDWLSLPSRTAGVGGRGRGLREGEGLGKKFGEFLAGRARASACGRFPPLAECLGTRRSAHTGWEGAPGGLSPPGARLCCLIHPGFLLPTRTRHGWGQSAFSLPIRSRPATLAGMQGGPALGIWSHFLLLPMRHLSLLQGPLSMGFPVDKTQLSLWSFCWCCSVS